VPLNRMGDLENPVELEKPDSEPAQWRLRSRSCAVADMIGAAASISLYAVAGLTAWFPGRRTRGCSMIRTCPA
jgi:hypothetical protein